MSDGIKYDKGKPLPDLVLGDFMPALQYAIFVGTFGASKYAPRNFQTLDNGRERYAEAGLRHYVKRKAEGEVFDDESGEFHLAHEIWDKIAELYFYLKERGDVTYEMAIMDALGTSYYCMDGDWHRDPFYWPEQAGRQALWHLMDDGVEGIKVDKREVVPVNIEEMFEEIAEEWRRPIDATRQKAEPIIGRIASISVDYGIRMKDSGKWLVGGSDHRFNHWGTRNPIRMSLMNAVITWASFGDTLEEGIEVAEIPAEVETYMTDSVFGIFLSRDSLWLKSMNMSLATWGTEAEALEMSLHEANYLRDSFSDSFRLKTEVQEL